MLHKIVLSNLNGIGTGKSIKYICISSSKEHFTGRHSVLGVMDTYSVYRPLFTGPHDRTKLADVSLQNTSCKKDENNINVLVLKRYTVKLGYNDHGYSELTVIANKYNLMVWFSNIFQ